MTFLLVDDAKISRTFIKNSLTRLRLPKDNFIEAKNGKEGLEELLKGNIDCVFLDIHMPELGGIEFLKVIRNYKNVKDVPIIVLTTDSNVLMIKEAITLGAIDYIVKPPEDKKLKAALKKIGA